MVLGKAELVANNDHKKVRSVKVSYPWPSVIRLNEYVRLPFQKIILTRRNILKRDGHRCAYCGRGDLPLTIDHIIPKSKGGDESWENLVAACIVCNNKKGDRTPEEANMKLLIKPYTPNHIMFIRNYVGKIEETWKPFLFH
ncbi:HNH endonuclease [Melioribacteraceae bacterium 4301-Me]|uniref:HNH endonuclease n=1 Tax=Pyranulibacter aquaticus TaxID=3163344 RepID=UPI00359ADA8E